MVVNKTKLTKYEPLRFLSHLCGGERQRVAFKAEHMFLSHLCGGEQIMEKFKFEMNFLSHLCGGERLYRLNVWLL